MIIRGVQETCVKMFPDSGHTYYVKRKYLGKGRMEDSEDALSVQLDMKLSDMGGDLKHVMSDSSLDLPGLSAHQPPASGEELVRLLW